MLLRILFLLSLGSFIYAEDNGTLVVTYRTGIKGERLDRIRFWLKSDAIEPQMYPKKGNSPDQENPLKKIVVIKDLKPGNYTLDFVVPNQDGLFEHVIPKDITITKDLITEVDQIFAPRYASLEALAFPLHLENQFSSPRLVLKNQAEELLKSSNGELAASQLLPGAYTLYFEDIPGYETPKPMTLLLGANEKAGPFIGFYRKSMDLIAQIAKPKIFYSHLLSVPGGEAIIGDPSNQDPQNQRPSRTVYISPFSIGQHEVTNQEFAKWLTQSLENAKVRYEKGFVRDLQDHLLCKTKEAEIYSQIVFHPEERLFTSVEGKEKHPVIDVSWYGAEAYSSDQNLRLPTEAEWEKAAGMALTSLGEPLKKYEYGFSENMIDPAWANYRFSDQSLQYFQVLTKEVGFYDGSNKIALPNGSVQQTHNAKSPIGAYDMSGNVWEWVSDWYSAEYEKDFPKKDPKGPESGSKKVVKGGCYDSLASGVRVAERLALSPEHTDPYTGFRVAK